MSNRPVKLTAVAQPTTEEAWHARLNKLGALAEHFKRHADAAEQDLAECYREFYAWRFDRNAAIRADRKKQHA